MTIRSVKNKNTEEYNRVNVLYRHEQIIRNFSNNDRGCLVVIKWSSLYMNTCLNMLNNDNFID